MRRSRNEARKKRTLRIRVKMHGTATRPRFVVYRSNAALAAQLIDDDAHVTIAAVSMKGKSVSVAKELGSNIAAIAKDKKITAAVFDRSGYRYHGVIKALADAAREGGLSF